MKPNEHPSEEVWNPSTGPHAATPELDDPRVIEALEEYLAAVEDGATPDRKEFLRRYADVADALAECLDGLHALHEVSSSRNAVPASPLPGTPVSESAPGTPLGDYRILREIGRGGMGVVYEAEQMSLGRRVALKVLPFAAALDARQLQRFKNEAQAAAHLHHTNIVPVYGIGVDRGVHFYAMQLIEGQNLASVLESLRRSERRNGELGNTKEDPPSARSSILPPSALRYPAPDTTPVLATEISTRRSGRSTEFFRTAARMTAEAAEALEYAHSVGVVHRDIKPANLLIDGRGHVWITDFGLAQFHADAGLTQSGDLLGTLRYMSPEQAGGRRVLIDHRTDVYSLGATLYEMLTLRPIFDGADRQALLRQILNDEPVPPRSLDRAIPPELETIVLKAVAKSPTDRYASSQEFADDLHRFLEDRPIRARRPSLLENATKWARRHRAVVVSAVVALLLCVAGLSVATLLTARAYERERQKAEEAAEQRARAEESFRQARQAVDQFAAVTEDELAGNPFLEGARRRLLEVALAYYRDFINQRQADPTLRAELQASRDKVETILRELTTLIGAGQYALLHQKPVQEELALTEEQRTALARIEQRWRDAYHEAGGLAPSEWERRRLDLARDQEVEVARLLTPTQFQRFRQIALQQRGPLAFSDPEVVAALQLTTEQKKRIREIQEETNAGFTRFGPPDRRPRPPDRPPEQWAEDWKRARERMLVLLTPSQRRQWDELTGEPFTGLLRPGFRPFGPR